MGKLRLEGDKAVKRNTHSFGSQSCTRSLAFLCAVNGLLGKLLNFSNPSFIVLNKVNR